MFLIYHRGEYHRKWVQNIQIEKQIEVIKRSTIDEETSLSLF
jgi:hypothetical protein